MNRNLSRDVIWNYASFATTAVCGIAFNVILGRFYPEEVLGRFNTVYSYYLVLSQLCVCGIHMAIVKYAAEEKGCSRILLYRALFLTVLISVTVSAVSCAIVNICLIRIMGPSMVGSFNTIWIALVLFSINKVILGWFNGKSLMRLFAIFQAARSIVIAISLLVFSLIEIEGTRLTYCFVLSESFLLVGELILYIIKYDALNTNTTQTTMRDLLWFGIRILPSNCVLELNTKIDVICLSILAPNEAVVGIYSFAAMIGEGFYQLFVVIRKIINPHITQKNAENILDKYIDNFKKSFYKTLLIGSTVFGVIVMIGFKILTWIVGKADYNSGMIVLFILCLFMILNSKAIVFGNILSQTGNPTQESVVNVLTVAVNGVLNVVLIRLLGMYGAALATGLSYCVYSLLQRFHVKSKLNYRM